MKCDPADPARRLRVLNATKTTMALADLETSLRERLPAVDEAIQRQLRGGCRPMWPNSRTGSNPWPPIGLSEPRRS